MGRKVTIASLQRQVTGLRNSLKKAKPKTRRGKSAMAVVLSIVAVISIVGIVTYWPKPPPQSSVNLGIFSVGARDQLALINLRSSDCPADLWSHKTGTSLNLKSNWVHSNEITNLAQVSAAVLDTTKYDQFWLNVSCQDDGGSTTFDDGLTRDYAARFQQIALATANVINLYQTPSSTDITLINADNSTVLDATLGINGNQNVTCIVKNAQNQFEDLCALVPYFNPVTQAWVHPTMSITFQNDVDGAGEFACEGIDAVASSDLHTITYELPSVYHAPWIGDFFWSYPDPANNITAWTFAMV